MTERLQTLPEPRRRTKLTDAIKVLKTNHVWSKQKDDSKDRDVKDSPCQSQAERRRQMRWRGCASRTAFLARCGCCGQDACTPQWWRCLASPRGKTSLWLPSPPYLPARRSPGRFINWLNLRLKFTISQPQLSSCQTGSMTDRTCPAGMPTQQQPQASLLAGRNSVGQNVLQQPGQPAVYHSLDDLLCTTAWTTCSVPQPGWPVVYHSPDNLQCTTAWMTCSVPQPGQPVVYHSLDDLQWMYHSLDNL